MGDGEQENGLLRSQEELDEDEIGDYLDAGYSPAERPLAVREWGITERESHGHESLSRRLAREEKPVDRLEGEGDFPGDTTDTDGEIIDDQVGAERSGRLVAWDTDVTGVAYDGDDYWARDVGTDGGAASAEESAVHIVDPDQYGSR
ncbi:DUF5709 domain-containing protein [Streptomyces sp. NRRL F-5126]|uniref:DUF5709 domain-containing protein n=1 Tax=Streptomyces sp. NRRL F-5126 TaxID=1463857 RepID=UPI0004C5BAF7|nr:DUF5709 domain-containing protein [Streptomyces sp. NRRL F-5126]